MAFELNQRPNLWNNGNGDHPVPHDRRHHRLLPGLRQQPGRDPAEVDDDDGRRRRRAAPRTGTLTDFTAFTDNVDAQGAVNAARDPELPAVELRVAGNKIPAKLFGEASLNLTTLLERRARHAVLLVRLDLDAHARVDVGLLQPGRLHRAAAAARPQLLRLAARSSTTSTQDGVKDAGEPGLAGFRIWADYDNDGVRDAGEPFDDTDANGNYTITNIQDPSGTYSLREQLARRRRHGRLDLLVRRRRRAPAATSRARTPASTARRRRT